jgi:hypothetical protein
LARKYPITSRRGYCGIHCEIRPFQPLPDPLELASVRAGTLCSGPGMGFDSLHLLHETCGLMTSQLQDVFALLRWQFLRERKERTSR